MNFATISINQKMCGKKKMHNIVCIDVWQNAIRFIYLIEYFRYWNNCFIKFMHLVRWLNGLFEPILILCIIPVSRTVRSYCRKKKHVTSHSDLRETLVCFSFWCCCCCCCCLVCAHYIEQFERNTLNGEKKKMWMKVHTLRQFIDSESDKTERRAFYFHSKTKCTYHFNICFSSPYFGGIQHFILHKKKPFEKSAILIGTVWNVRVVVIPAKWSLWKIFHGKKITWYETKLQFSDLFA